MSCFRYFAACLLLALAPACLAQAVTIRVLNSRDGHPLARQSVSVSFLYGHKGTPPKHDSGITLETDANGEARFTIPDPAPVHLAAQIRPDWSRWRCSCAVFPDTQIVIQKGIAGPFPADVAKKLPAGGTPRPGEILFVATPLSFLERIFYPLLKE
jgi:hypothetical protein